MQNAHFRGVEEAVAMTAAATAPAHQRQIFACFRPPFCPNLLHLREFLLHVNNYVS